MRIKDKKRFIIACGGLAAILIAIIVLFTVRLYHSGNNAQVADKTASAKITSTQEATTENNSPTTTAETGNDAGDKTSSTSTDSITALVNKNHSISASYVPNDLVTLDLPSTRDTQLRSDAAEALVKLFNAARSAGLDLYCCSGYRSYENQSELYDWNVSTYGAEQADLVSARPGMSEHQLGLAMDVTSASVGFDLLESFGTTAEGQFLKNNAYKYGFIIRYPQDKTDITGYAYEPWHIRYLGVDVATDIYNSGKTMEEYYGVN
ncbi:M15 family metallopeptidase [Acetobacterium tundrae]|uniref:D-alanyl-D-alanine carboxypeptidase family protein n=1 Tax=Acetobacterium tundrae TaxID=132932 RepID=A0ABR6WGZ2_9FIRM|nr:M15 family metallopeptidase [Acetobacterium tundrae]MBC3795742.1 D-alanyl-D-alanine carboxypeptidase family protein [Acetobacterium tundrae]